VFKNIAAAKHRCPNQDIHNIEKYKPYHHHAAGDDGPRRQRPQFEGLQESLVMNFIESNRSIKL